MSCDWSKKFWIIITACGLNISFDITFPRTFLSSAVLRPGYKEHIIGSKKASVLPEPLIALNSKLNFFLFGSRATYKASSWTLVGLFLFCCLSASMMFSSMLNYFHFFLLLMYSLSSFSCFDACSSVFSLVYSSFFYATYTFGGSIFKNFYNCWSISLIYLYIFLNAAIDTVSAL